MNLSALLSALRQLPEYDGVREVLGTHPAALGLPRAARLPLLASLAADSSAPMLLVTARSDRALLFNEELLAWLTSGSARTVHFFPEPNPLPYEYAPWGPRTTRQRLTTLGALAAHSNASAAPLVIASARALITRTMPRRDFLAASRTLHMGQEVRLEKLIETWIGAGYTPETIVSEPGQFSRRGGIIDIWIPADEYPARIELFGDEIEHIRRFDASTQRSGDGIDAIHLMPAREALPKHSPALGNLAHTSLPPDDLERLSSGIAFATLEYFLTLMHPTPASVLNYLPANTQIFVDDWNEFADTVNDLESQALELRNNAIEQGLISDDFPPPILSWSDLQDDLSRLPIIHLGQPPDGIPARDLPLGRHFTPGPRFGGQLRHIVEHLQSSIIAPRHSTIVVTRQAARLADLWGEENHYLAPVEIVPTDPPPLTFLHGALAEGFELQAPRVNLQLLTDSELFGWARPEPRRRRLAAPRAETPESHYADFHAGDLVVHIDYGIGRYAGLVKRSIESIEREYLHIEYDGGDDLYVPIIQADRITKYIGANDSTPALSRLGTAEWSNTRQRAQQAAEEVARELLDLYAKREVSPGRAFSPDSTWQKELEAAFGYVETDDQLKAIDEVKRDMEHPRPMDRLICGDVGYGKTEVALRAAFKAVNDGAQVAVLVPTTVLAQQHFNTFSQRLAAYPLRVEMLSRFRTPLEQEEIIAKLASGEIDIVIGTHRLVQKDVVFRDLGLVIIDEEQRFGVTHKERLKQLRTEVDVLTMTATPIPRTLYMSLAGIRDISMIQTPPDERLPVITQVGPYNERTVRQAILRELDRGGQVFFLHNRIESIGIVRNKLRALVPEARIGVAHGQMDEHQLSQAMDAFTQNEIDVLLCTSIIESGLDIPNANTLIVDRADMFGLAQLYQLRGRVGRGANRAYAYFFYDRKLRMTPEARQRLETISEQTELGAGYGIAMRDLEMRGAGDVLGVRQHGQIASVGFHLYTRLLSQAVKTLKAQKPAGDFTVASPDFDFGIGISIDLPLPATIPSDYIPDRNLRLRLYRRLAEIKTEPALANIRHELADRFGALPDAVSNLLFQIQIKLMAQRAMVEAIASENGQIVLRSRLWESEEGQSKIAGAVDAAARISKGKVWLPRATSDSWREGLLSALQSLAKEYDLATAN